MKTHLEHTRGRQSVATPAAMKKPRPGGRTPIMDYRSSTLYQRKLRETMNTTPGKAALVQRKRNNTGLPDPLKTGIETLSGYSMDDVKVHYNSGKPAQLQALAYAQGTDIHLAPGQEKHLPHEAWHVVQQKQGRVKPTMQLKGKVNVNDDAGLEKEASIMGGRAKQMNSLGAFSKPLQNYILTPSSVQTVAQRKLIKDRLNVVGENHEESGYVNKEKDLDRRRDEKSFCQEKTGSDNYWLENKFIDRSGISADPPFLRNDRFLMILNTIYVEVKLTVDTSKIGIYQKTKKEITSRLNMFYQYLNKDLNERIGIEKDSKELDTFFEENESLKGKIYTAIEMVEKTKKKEDLIHVIQGPFFQEVMIALSRLVNVKEKYELTSGKPLKDIDLLKHISFKRSEGMHVAANGQSHLKGVWKVGDSHVEDMKKMDGIQYHLVSKKDFNDAFYSTDKYSVYDAKHKPQKLTKVKEKKPKKRFFSRLF